MGIEAQLPNYLSEGSGLGIFQDGLERWGFEEARHEPTLKLVLANSGVRTEDKIREVEEGFGMPALDSLPNRREFVRALARTRIYDGLIHRQQVVEPTLRVAGLAA